MYEGLLALRTLKFLRFFRQGGGVSVWRVALLMILVLSPSAGAQATSLEVAESPDPVAAPPQISEILQLKPLYLETPLVEAGVAIPIVVPADGAYNADAAVIANAIEAAGGSRPAVIKDDAFGIGLAIDQHLIVLGNRSTNKLLSALYARHYSLTDLRYPGPGGHEVRTLHNPLGNGKNVIIIGGSDAAGVTNATLLFSQRVGEVSRSDQGLTMGPLMEIQLGAGITPPMDLEQFTTWDGSAVDGNGPGWNSISKRMAMYYMTGDPFHAQEALRLAFPNEQAKAELEVLDGARFDNINEPLSEPNPAFAHRMVLYWDLIEESSVFSDDDRLKVTRALAKQVEQPGLAEILANSAVPEAVGTASAQWRALALYSLGRYFARDYSDPFWPAAMEKGSTQFQSLHGHAWVVGAVEPPEAYNAAIAPVLSCLELTGDRAPVDNGVLKILLRGQEILASGRESDWALRQGAITFFHQAADLTGDGRWVEYARRAGANLDAFRVGQSWWPSVAPAPPAGLADAWQVHSLPSALWQSRNTGLSEEESFQFMSYRSASDATGDYILFQGFDDDVVDGNGGPGLLELRQAGQTILQGTHNQFHTQAEGVERSGTPVDAALIHQRVLGEMAVAVTEVRGADVADWRRTLLNRQGHYTLILDTFTPQVDSTSFEAQLTWAADQGAWAVGPGASCVLLPGAPDPSKTPTIQSSRAMAPIFTGKEVTFHLSAVAAIGQPQHLFTAIARGPVGGGVACVPLNEHAAALRLPQPAVAASGSFDDLEGELVLLSPDYVYGLNLVGARELIRTDAPIEIAWDLSGGIIEVVTSKITAITLALEGPEKLRLDRTPLTGDMAEGRLRITLEAGRHRITGATLSQGRLDVNIAWVNEAVNKAIAEAQPAP